jgi:hypothetical protein
VFPVVDTGAPLVYLEFPEAIGAPAIGSVVGRYTIDQIVAFRCLVPAVEGVPDDEAAARVENDIKKLMNALEPTLKAAGMTYADYVGSSPPVFRLVRAYPVQVTVNFNIRFRQLKSAPGG